MTTRALVAACVVLLSGCASAGTGSSSQEAASVPVYEGADAVPCRFEVIRVVRGEATVPFASSRELFERERERVLGRQGARFAADAVVVREATATSGRAVSMPANQVPTTRTIEFEGEAVRFLPGTCRDGR